ncbi:DUF1761 domain-containing protein [Actinophytocola oryzae]|uniref:Uncharacterized protein DUF1761 n=1 Tax=Actinophytocola oryzae TaxID=502181 RepID=A0A4V6Q6Y1_9PSEU|nr:DUF1761 domain-containing protein [Actinophytocola oryzae]TDV54941.1 uncharacterized protein DUF1761 [Actinophytocola oryzae]
MTVFLAILTSALASFVISSVWYAVLDRERAVGGRPSPLVIVAELGRSALVAGAVVGLAKAVGTSAVGPLLLLALVLWAAFPFVLLSGSVLWDRVPVGTAARHGGDWLVKLLAVSTIVGLWL